MQLMFGTGRFFFDLQLSKEKVAMAAPSAAAANTNKVYCMGVNLCKVQNKKKPPPTSHSMPVNVAPYLHPLGCHASTDDNFVCPWCAVVRVSNYL